MNLELLIPVLILGPMAAFGLALLPRLWTERAMGPPPQASRRRWSFRAAREQGHTRVLPAAILALTALVLSMAAVLVEEGASGAVAQIAERAALAAFVAFVAFVFCGITVTLFNRPKLLVPPATRDEAGALALWLRGRRR
jgi:hypothetical protein